MEGLRRLLEAAEGLRVVAAETSLIEGMEAVRELRPSVVVVDKGLGIHALIDWLLASQRLPSPPAALVWGACLSADEVLRLLQAGAAGVVRKTSKLDSILNSIRTVACGGTWLEDDMLREANRHERSDRSTLTPRESQVLEMVQQGMRNKEIAMNLGISIGTVKIHLKHIFEKTGVHGRYGLAVSSLKEKGVLAALVV
jgi:two-component system nitrate/nitrite response regulator NarL